MPRLTKASPGSTAWLLHHELRLQWRNLKVSSWIVPAGIIAATVQLAGLAIGRLLATLQVPFADRLLAASILLAFLAMLMLSQAFGVAIEALFTRRDLEWLLTSPVPFRRVLLVRMVGMAAGGVWFWLLLLGACANGAAIFGQPRLLAAYPVLCALAMVVTAIATSLTIALVPALGLRRTRAVASGLAVVTGAVPFLASQSGTIFGPGVVERFWRASAPCCGVPSGPGWWPARAMLGSPAALVPVLLFGLGSAVLTGWALERRFAAGAAATPTVGASAAAPRSASAAKFHAGPSAALLRKETRLLIRTPGLLGRAFQQMIYLAPLGLTLLRADSSSGGFMRFVVGTLPIVVAEQLAQLFISVAMSSDEAAELAQSAPVSPRAVRMAKLKAAALAVMCVLAAPALLVAARLPGAAPALLAGVVCVSSSELLFGLWFPSPTRKLDLGALRAGFGAHAMLSLANLAVWCAATSLLLSASAWAILPALVGVGGLIAVKPNPRRHWP